MLYQNAVIEPTREIRFRRTPLMEATTEVWMPIFRSTAGDHEFLGYYQARPDLEECKRNTVQGTHGTGHRVTGYAKVRVEVTQVVGLPAADPEVPEIYAGGEEEVADADVV
jgi:hypothetical protein